MEDVGTPGKVTCNGTRTAVVATYFVRPQIGGLSISLVCSSQSKTTKKFSGADCSCNQWKILNI